MYFCGFRGLDLGLSVTKITKIKPNENFPLGTTEKLKTTHRSNVVYNSEAV